MSIPDPILAIREAPEFAATHDAMAQHPASRRSLVSHVSRALLYSVIRQTKPDDVIEIGTYAGGTSEILALALEENGRGTLHTVSPFDAARFGPIFAGWPPELRARTKVYETNSMSFFMAAAEHHLRVGVTLVDGNHDYEFAAFDIAAAARIATPGGFIFIDNISQCGPFSAAMDFLTHNPGWTICGRALPKQMRKPFDRDRISIDRTDFIVLRAPSLLSIGLRPVALGEAGWGDAPLHGFRVDLLALRSPGVLHVQSVLRTFAADEITERAIETSIELCPGEASACATFSPPVEPTGQPSSRRTIESWLWWTGADALDLAGTPTAF